MKLVEVVTLAVAVVLIMGILLVQSGNNTGAGGKEWYCNYPYIINIFIIKTLKSVTLNPRNLIFWGFIMYPVRE